MSTSAERAEGGPARSRTLPFLLVGLLVAVVLAGVVSQYASSDPDGLEKVSQDQGFAASASDSAVDDSPLADYGTSGIESSRLSGGIAGVVGVAVTFLLAGAVSLLIRRRGEPSAGAARAADSPGSTGSAGSNVSAGSADSGGSPVPGRPADSTGSAGSGGQRRDASG